jgi:hypothetical protein
VRGEQAADGAAADYPDAHASSFALTSA